MCCESLCEVFFLNYPFSGNIPTIARIFSFTLALIITPRAHARARGYVIGRGVHIYIVWTFFWNQSFISKNTHFEMSILTQIGFSSNLMASGTVQQLDKSSWPSQIPIVCRLGKGSPIPETHIAPNHTPTIADTVPKWLNTPTLLLGTWH